MQHVGRLRDDFVAGVIEGMDDWKQTHLIRKHARFIDPQTLDLDGERLTTGRVIIATGSQPVIPAPWQRFDEYLLDTERFFALETLPASLVVMGLGPVGIELAQALHRLGATVTAVDLDRGIGGLTDPELQDYAIKQLSGEMALRFAQAEITDATVAGVTVTAGDETIRAERALVATGRRPAVDDLDLDKLGVELDDHGLPDFDSATLQVGDLPVFLAGDVNAERPLLHEASDEGRIAGYNAVRDEPEGFIRRTPLAITFSSPNIAVVGHAYGQLRERGVDFVSGSASFENQGRARMMNAAGGLLKVYAERRQGRLLGAELFAPHGEHLAHLLALAITAGMTVADLLTLPWYHPVLEEGLRTAVRDAAKQGETPVSYAELMRCQDNPVV
jgi:dihydrolipoamide dehydrogenase